MSTNESIQAVRGKENEAERGLLRGTGSGGGIGDDAEIGKRPSATEPSPPTFSLSKEKRKTVFFNSPTSSARHASTRGLQIILKREPVGEEKCLLKRLEAVSARERFRMLVIGRGVVTEDASFSMIGLGRGALFSPFSGHLMPHHKHRM